MKASIDKATARDNDNAQLRAELQEAKKREEENIDKNYEAWCDRWKYEHDKRVVAEEMMKRLEEENSALNKQVSQTKKREQAALKKLGNLKKRLRELGR